MSTWYEAATYLDHIRPVEVASETKKLVMIGNSRRLKTSDVVAYRTTKQAAWQWLIDTKTSRRNQAAAWLDACEPELSVALRSAAEDGWKP